ncbi:glycine-rich protein 2-like [Pyrus ussuriensis x Pyrus communis]|uniref:Glycine-rich protein 2-like n=1 Tax=Pyrus ussuriensis x Pyrus communis TaxID=2448454 RepID=A0A5N5HLI6_9ROSA|nr:glycine-rich protein 2-like [Pyrus ussuriensis x Pyrus communis]
MQRYGEVEMTGSTPVRALPRQIAGLSALVEASRNTSASTTVTTTTSIAASAAIASSPSPCVQTRHT